MRLTSPALVLTLAAGLIAATVPGPAQAGTHRSAAGPVTRLRASQWSNAPAVAAVFPNTTGSGNHGCTAAVVASATHDTVITAAHCITGTGTNLSIVPGYRYGAKPYGVWRVTKVYADTRWTGRLHPAYDVAVLKIAKKRINGRLKGIQDLTGGYALGRPGGAGVATVLGGYNGGSGDAPVRCAAPLGYTRGYPTITCDGFSSGTSGSPFLRTIGSVTYVTGVIGGLNHGGCYPWVSHSAPFTSAPWALLRRAEAGAAGSRLPYPGGDGC